MSKTSLECSSASDCSLASPPDILCEFCEKPLCVQCVRTNTFGSCCEQCDKKIEDGVCTERGESVVMGEIVKLVAAYGDASFDCGEHSGDGYERVNETRRDARRDLLKYVAEHIKE